MLTPLQARALVLGAEDRTVTQRVPSHLALGRALAEDIRGQQCLTAGEALQPPHLAMLAQLGVAEIPTFAPTGVAFVTLAAAAREADDWTACPAAAALLGAAARADQIPIDLSAVAIDEDAHAAAVSRALDLADIVCSLGAGPADAAAMAQRFEGEVIFAGVAQAPGAELSFASLAEGWWFGLPGDPADALLCFRLFVAPLARKFAGHRAYDPPALPLALAEAVGSSQVHRWDWAALDGDRVRLLHELADPLCRADLADGVVLAPPAGAAEPPLFYRLR